VDWETIIEIPVLSGLPELFRRFQDSIPSRFVRSVAKAMHSNPRTISFKQFLGRQSAGVHGLHREFPQVAQEGRAQQSQGLLRCLGMLVSERPQASCVDVLLLEILEEIEILDMVREVLVTPSDREPADSQTNVDIPIFSCIQVLIVAPNVAESLSGEESGVLKYRIAQVARPLKCLASTPEGRVGICFRDKNGLRTRSAQFQTRLDNSRSQFHVRVNMEEVVARRCPCTEIPRFRRRKVGSAEWKRKKRRAKTRGCQSRPVFAHLVHYGDFNIRIALLKYRGQASSDVPLRVSCRNDYGNEWPGYPRAQRAV